MDSLQQTSKDKKSFFTNVYVRLIGTFLLGSLITFALLSTPLKDLQILQEEKELLQTKYDAQSAKNIQLARENEYLLSGQITPQPSPTPQVTSSPCVENLGSDLSISSSSQEGWLTATSPSNGIQIGYPSDWSAKLSVQTDEVFCNSIITEFTLTKQLATIVIQNGGRDGYVCENEIGSTFITLQDGYELRRSTSIEQSVYEWYTPFCGGEVCYNDNLDSQECHSPALSDYFSPYISGVDIRYHFLASPSLELLIEMDEIVATLKPIKEEGS